MKRAFTLIEVLVALAIFAMVSIVLGSAYLNVLNSYAAVGRGHEDDQDIAFVRQQLLTQPDFTTAQNGDQYTRVDGSQVTWSAAIDANINVVCRRWAGFRLWRNSLIRPIGPDRAGALVATIDRFLPPRRPDREPSGRVKQLRVTCN